MDASDVIVGERYEMSFDECVTVLACGVVCSGPRGGQRSDGILVRTEQDATELVVFAGSLRRLWSEYEADRAESERAQGQLEELRRMLGEAQVEGTCWSPAAVSDGRCVEMNLTPQALSVLHAALVQSAARRSSALAQLAEPLKR